MKFSQLVFATLCAGTLLGGCKGKDGEPGPAGPAGAGLSGNVVGFVYPFDEFGRPQAKSGVTVTAENTNPLVTATTDANGRYELVNLKSGTYNFAYSKAGYGTYKVQGYPHAGGDQPAFLYDRQIIGISTTTVTGFSISSPQPPSSGGSGPSEEYVELSATLTNPNQPSNGGQFYYSPRVAVYVGATPNVTAATGQEVTMYSSSSQGNQLLSSLTRSSLNREGFATGTNAYAIMYGTPAFYDYSYYYDTLTGKRINTSLSANPSQVVPFIVP